MSNTKLRDTLLGAELDQPVVERPQYRYAIFSQQRTGSHWLCARLMNLGGFGLPTEYLNRPNIPQLAARLKVPLADDSGGQGFKIMAYMRAVERVRTSPSGRFGIKIQPNQLFPLLNGDMAKAAQFLQQYDALIILTRRDKLAQAVSGAIAQVSGKWWTDGREPALADVNVERMMGETAIKLGRYMVEVGQMNQVCKATGRPVLQLTYEDMLAEPEATFASVVNFLGGQGELENSAKTALVDLPEPPPGRLAAEVRARFLDYIQGKKI